MGVRTTADCPRWAYCPDFQWRVVNVKLRDGSALRGFSRNWSERDGETLWSVDTNDSWRATPMTYMVDGRQYVAAAAGTNIIAFAIGGASPTR